MPSTAAFNTFNRSFCIPGPDILHHPSKSLLYKYPVGYNVLSLDLISQDYHAHLEILSSSALPVASLLILPLA